MAPRKKTEPVATNVNNNHNTNNITLNVEQPKALVPQEKKPNWAVKALVLGIISLVLGLIGYFVQQQIDGNGKKPTIHNAPISGEKVTR